MQRPFRYSLLYDGECPVCLASVRRLRRMDRGDHFEYLPIRDDEVGARFPELSREALNGSLHLVGPSGEVWEGAEAVEKITSLSGVRYDPAVVQALQAAVTAGEINAD